MRLFIVERISLHDLAVVDDGPGEGDVVAYFRPLQDPHGSARKDSENRGITVLWAEALISNDVVAEIDALYDRFLETWYKPGGTDITLSGDASFGEFISPEIALTSYLNHLVRFGEICRRLLDRYAQAEAVLSDIEDGPINCSGRFPGLPRRRLLADLASGRGIAFRGLPLQAPIPLYRLASRHFRLGSALRAYLGGFRPRYLLSRLSLRRAKDNHPTAYIFLYRGLDLVAEALARAELRVIVDRSDGLGLLPVRYDHFAFVPRLGDIPAALRIRRHLAAMRRGTVMLPQCRLMGVDYGRYFALTLEKTLKIGIWVALIRWGQARRMLRRCRPDLIVINGIGNPASRVAVEYAKHTGCKIVYIGHGLNVMPYILRCVGRNYRHVVFAVYGRDHLEEYARDLPPDLKPRRPILTNPRFAVMNDVRKRRTRPAGGRILMLGYAANGSVSVARAHNFDRYTLDLFAVAGRLAADGIGVTYRPHFADNREYVRFTLRSLGLEDKVAIEDDHEFPAALSRHDVLVTNASSCLYQALYAGWPTVFYEPDFDPRHFTGLIGATDIERPIASSPDELERLIRTALDSDSWVAHFPEKFSTEYADRFIGEGAERADEVLHDFLLAEIGRPRADARDNRLYSDHKPS